MKMVKEINLNKLPMTSPFDLVEFVKSFPLQHFNKNELLCSAGETPAEILFIREGFVKTTTTHSNTSDYIVWIAGRYDVVPSESFFNLRRKTQFDYTALSNGNGYRVARNYFVEMSTKYPIILKHIAGSFSDHYDNLLAHIGASTQSTARSKIIHCLKLIAARFSVSDQVDLYDLGLTLTHKDIADMIGSSRETASIELKILMDEDLISYSRSSFIIHTDRLTALTA